ncbi:MAG: SH3 domain-containing protein [Treponema sp.]|nr:SH3 domain-containing protein [Treponema sp.]
MKKFLPLLFIFSILFTSCSDKIMGYSVVLWNIPEQDIKSGDILPVYIKSNISHVYVVQKPDGEKIEIPLWQLTEPVKKSKISSVLKKYEPTALTYASVKTDGLPCRAEAVNTSKQVYRLRKGEVIKILYKGTGQIPMTGGVPLEGDWYKILTEDGTSGWCFSYNLKLYETDGKDNGTNAVQETVKEEVDNAFNVIKSRIWYPDSFRTMINSGNIDLSVIHPSYNFFIDEGSNKVSFNTNKIHESWEYQGYSKTGDNEYVLKNVPVKLIYKRANYIVLRYTDSSGKPQDFDYVTLDQNINDVVNAEKTRRTAAYEKIVKSGPSFKSSSYGTISFDSDGTFKWTNYRLLVPSIIEASAKNAGTASVKYSVAKSLSSNYDGVITLKFDGMNSEVHFLYKIDDSGIRLEDTASATFKGIQITERSSSPVIMYFKKN